MIIILALCFIYFYNKTHMYGNDEESIVKFIKSIEGYENASIEVLEIKDFGEYRVVALLTNNSPAYARFLKNKVGNYRWIDLEKRSGSSFSSFPMMDINVRKFLIVTNQDNDIAKLQLSANGQLIEQDFPVKKKSVKWIDLPKSEDNSYTFKYKYFDSEGNLIPES